MAVKREFSISIVDVEKIEEINKVIIKRATALQQYSIYFYFGIVPQYANNMNMDLTLFTLESETKSDLDKKLNDLIEELNELNTDYSIRDENTHELIVEIEHMTALEIKFDNVKSVKKGTYEKIDNFNHLKTEFGICKVYNPNFRPVESILIEGLEVKPETIYLFSDSEKNLSKLKAFVLEKIMEIDSNLEIEFKPFMFID